MMDLEWIKELSWTEKELPQKERTKHVHSLHQYMGKFVPQIVEYFLERDLKNSKLICDPFMGSGTTLIESNIKEIPSIGLDVSKFNVMLCDVKTKNYNIGKLKKEADSIFEKTLLNVSKTTLGSFISNKQKRKLGMDSEYLKTWYHSNALHGLLVFRDLISEYDYQDVFNIVLSRSARSSRMIAHYEVDYPKKPYTHDYYCFKHKGTCHPTQNSITFLKRYCTDVVKRINAYAHIKSDADVKVIHGDSSTFDFSEYKISDVFTSPPYIGLLDYHEQHRYAYELLGLDDNSSLEIGRKKNGTGKMAISNYQKSMTKTIKNVSESLDKNGSFIIVVNDKLELYDEIVSNAGMKIERRLSRSVNRRSGRRGSSFTEDILICKSRD